MTDFDLSCVVSKTLMFTMVLTEASRRILIFTKKLENSIGRDSRIFCTRETTDVLNYGLGLANEVNFLSFEAIQIELKLQIEKKSDLHLKPSDSSVTNVAVHVISRFISVTRILVFVVCDVQKKNNNKFQHRTLYSITKNYSTYSAYYRG